MNNGLVRPGFCVISRDLRRSNRWSAVVTVVTAPASGDK